MLLNRSLGIQHRELVNKDRSSSECRTCPCQGDINSYLTKTIQHIFYNHTCNLALPQGVKLTPR